VRATSDELVIINDAYLSALYETAYGRLRKVVAACNPDATVEIGSGLGLALRVGCHWMTSDIDRGAHHTAQHAAQQLPYRTGSLDALVLKDTWHHIPDIEAFLTEAHRVLRTGGMVAVFDPYWGWLARFVYRFLHQERWDAVTREWTFDSSDPWDSNQALTYLMLRRDRAEFMRRWGARFSVHEHGALIGPSFLLSGGVSRRTSISGTWLRRLLAWEDRRGRWFDHLRFFHVFRLVKT
jgi:SAM-dependent methyltransferase